MSIASISLVIAICAVCTTAAITAGLRAWAAIRQTRADRYRERIAENLIAFVVEAAQQPPAPPRGRLEREVMHAEITRLAAQLKGSARDTLASLFDSYGLLASARRDLRSRDSLTVIRAAELIETMRAAECVGDLQAGLSSRDWLVRVACARALADIGVSSAMAQIADAVPEGDGDEGPLGEILTSFGAAGESFLVGRLRGAHTVAQKQTAAAVLGEIHATTAVGDLVDVLRSPDDQLVVRAAHALGSIGDRSAVEPLTALLQQPRSPSVLVSAADALGTLEDPASGPALVHALSAEDWALRDAAARALIGVGESGLQAVVEHLDEIPASGIAHFMGLLDVADRLGGIIDRASAGDPAMDRLVRTAYAAGVRSRLDDVAASRTSSASGYAAAIVSCVEVPA